MRRPDQFQPGHLREGFPAPWSDDRRRRAQAKGQKTMQARKVREELKVSDPWSLAKR